MKLTITNTAQNPTMLWTTGGGFHELAPGATSPELEIDDGQAEAYTKQAGLEVKGYKAPKPGSTDGRKTEHKGADAVLQAELEASQKRVVELEQMVVDLTKRAEDAERTVAELQAVEGQDVAEDDADDLRKQAIGLGIKVDKRWTDETVQRKIDEKLAS